MRTKRRPVHRKVRRLPNSGFPGRRGGGERLARTVTQLQAPCRSDLFPGGGGRMHDGLDLGGRGGSTWCFSLVAAQIRSVSPLTIGLGHRVPPPLRRCLVHRLVVLSTQAAEEVQDWNSRIHVGAPRQWDPYSSKAALGVASLFLHSRRRVGRVGVVRPGWSGTLGSRLLVVRTPCRAGIRDGGGGP